MSVNLSRVDAVLADLDELISLLVGLGQKPPRSRCHCHTEQLEAAMTVRAKFFVQEVAKTTYGGRIKLNVVSRGQDNKEWASATPSGQIEMTVRNDHALAQFEPGDEFFVDFVPAPKGEEGMGG